MSEFNAARVATGLQMKVTDARYISDKADAWKSICDNPAECRRLELRSEALGADIESRARNDEAIVVQPTADGTIATRHDTVVNDHTLTLAIPDGATLGASGGLTEYPLAVQRLTSFQKGVTDDETCRSFQARHSQLVARKNSGNDTAVVYPRLATYVHAPISSKVSDDVDCARTVLADCLFSLVLPHGADWA